MSQPEVPWLATLPDRVRRDLSALGTEIRVGVGKALTTEAGVGREAFVVLEGTATVLVGGEPVAHAGPGAFVGEMSLLDHRQRSATVVAETDMRLLVFDPRSFADLLDHQPVLRELGRQLSERLRAAQPGPEPSG